MRWLVEARNKTQSLMADLYEAFPCEHVSVDETLRDRLHLMLGAAFSLWRAVFLISPEDSERSFADLEGDAREFLKRVIDTNAITFNDELRWRAWSGGYYLNNARQRVFDLGKKRGFEGSVPSNVVLRKAWNKIYEELDKIIKKHQQMGESQRS